MGAVNLENNIPTRDPATLHFNDQISVDRPIDQNVLATTLRPSHYAMVWKSSFPINAAQFFLCHSRKGFVTGSSSNVLVGMIARRALKCVLARRAGSP
jgi:hypothetical protein